MIVSVKPFAALALALTLSACVSVAAVGPGPLKTEAGFTVDAQNQWSRFPNGMGGGLRGSMLTRHGAALDRIDLLTVTSGETLLIVPKTAKAPTFTADQSDLDLVELVTATLTRLQYANVTAANVRPATVVGHPGLRFDLTGAYSSGLKFRGDVALAKVDGKLHVMWLIAPEIHYFGASASEFEAMVASSRLTG